jgi:hypothetical protein
MAEVATLSARLRLAEAFARDIATEDVRAIRDELQSLIVKPPPPRRAPAVQGMHSVDVIERAVATFDRLAARLSEADARPSLTEWIAAHEMRERVKAQATRALAGDHDKKSLVGTLRVILNLVTTDA